MPEHTPVYCGRFAPSPTGPLHFGSLVAAVGSYLEARSRGGRWLLRMDDLDKPREVPGAAAQILLSLERFGFEWDGEVLYQSQRSEAYAAALAQLSANGQIYACACTRREIAQLARPGIDGPVYPGTCRNADITDPAILALRVRTDSQPVILHDRLQGRIAQCLQVDVGDFVLQRADGLTAYQLAVVVDDAWQGVNHVVRGSDLLDSTPRQIYLQQLLGYPAPEYLHLPVAVNPAGDKLSKQTHAPAVDESRVSAQLSLALGFLGQRLPQALLHAPPAELWDWAIAHWDSASIPASRSLPSPL